MVLSDLAKCGLRSGVWIDEYNYQNKEKSNIAKSMSLLVFRALYQSKSHVIPHTVIAVILNISKHRKQQQLQIQPLLKTIRKTIGKKLLTAIRLNFALKWRPSWTPS